MRWVPVLLSMGHGVRASPILAAWLTQLAPFQSTHLHQQPVVLVDGARTPRPAHAQSFQAMLAAAPLRKSFPVRRCTA